MIRPVPPPDPDALRTSARWCSGLADALADARLRMGGFSELVDRDWPDTRGREWAELAGRLRRELGRQAEAAVELGEMLARRAADAEDYGGSSAPVVGPAQRSGARLGGTDASRVGADRGVRIAELPDPISPS